MHPRGCTYTHTHMHGEAEPGPAPASLTEPRTHGQPASAADMRCRAVPGRQHPPASGLRRGRAPEWQEGTTGTQGRGAWEQPWGWRKCHRKHSLLS